MRENRSKRNVAAVVLCVILLMCGVIFTGGIAHGKVETDNSCYNCHYQLGGRMKVSADGWEKSIHRKVGITCDVCHGGNPYITSEDSMSEKYNFRGVPTPFEIPELCGSCHSDVKMMKQYNLRTDQWEEYKTSQHGILLAQGDPNVATCVSCHGTHEIRKKSDPLSSVFHTNVPETCAKCHANEELMSKYGIPANQYDLYRKGYHGKILYGEVEGKNPLLVPNCATCHGIHGARPPGVEEVPNVCGNCHSNIYEYFRMGPHGEAVKETGEPRCVDCHGNHKNDLPTPAMFDGSEEGHCGYCHDESEEAYRVGQEIKEKILFVQEKLEELTGVLEEAKKTGKFIDRLESAVTELSAQFVQMRPKTHALNPGILRRNLIDADDQIRIAEEEVEKMRAQDRLRVRVALAGSGLFLILGLLFVAKLFQVRREEGDREE